MISYALLTDENKNVFYPIAIYNNLPPTLKKIMIWNLNIDVMILALIGLGPYHITVYFFNHFRYQYLMLLHYIKNINCGYNFFKFDNLIWDENYQMQIKKRLKFCIERHVHINS